MKKIKLTPEQQKLSDQAKLLKDFVNDCISRNANTANDVFLKLYGADFKVPADPKQSIASDLISYAYGFLNDLQFEGSGIVSWVIGGIINHYKEQYQQDPNSLPGQLAEDASDINERIYRTLNQAYMDLAQIQQDPVAHWNDTYTVPFGNKGQVAVNELINWEIPSSDTQPVNYGLMLDQFRTGLTYQVAKNEIVSRNLYKIGYPLVINWVVGAFQSLIVSPETCQDGHQDIDWTPLITPYMIWKLNQGDETDGNCIVNRCPKINGGPAEFMHPFSAKNNPCTEQDWKHSAGDYMSNICKSSYLSCHTIETMSDGVDCLYYRTFYLIDSKYQYEQESDYGYATWYVVDDSFCDWLFKDDGFGNIVNPNGIATRKDVFENWGLQGSKGVTPPQFNQIKMGPWKELGIILGGIYRRFRKQICWFY